MKPGEVVKSTQEQAVAAWVNYLNQLRLDALLAALDIAGENLESALEAFDGASEQIAALIESNRGSGSGLHGFIAEIAEVGLGNAKQRLKGNPDIYTWVDNNGPVDLIRDGVDIQMKFWQAGGRFSLDGVADHLAKYPNFLDDGGVYQIPADHYEMVKELYEMPAEYAYKHLVRGGNPSLAQWKNVHQFFDQTGMDIDRLTPSEFKYGDVQAGAIDGVMKHEREDLQEQSDAVKRAAYEDSKPTLSEGVKATAAAAAIEGATTLAMAIHKHVKQGKKLGEFTQDDWTEIAEETGVGTLKGAARGASIYALTNFTATPAAVASSLVTASFGVAEQAHLFREGDITETEFLENSLVLSLDVSVSALSSFVGQCLIPVPVLGAVIGNAVGIVLYQAAKDGLSEYEQQLISDFAAQQRALDEQLAAQYGALLETLRVKFALYLELIGRAFSPDPWEAFDGSIAIAYELGVPTEQVLDSIEEVDEFFLG